MTHGIKAAAAALLALAGSFSAGSGAAEAGWRDHARKHGAGFYVEKYADQYVTQDNKYKGSKHDKHSGEYYNTKTGKWTGKKYDGEYSSNEQPRKNVAAKKSGTPVAAVQKKPSAASKSVAQNPGRAVVSEAVPQSSAYSSGEVYGPPMPEELARFSK